MASISNSTSCSVRRLLGIDVYQPFTLRYSWLGDSNLPLPDLDTTNPTVRTDLQAYIKAFVQEYNVDGLRIDAAKHVESSFWPLFCNEGGAAGVFCIGEVYVPDVP